MESKGRAVGGTEHSWCSAVPGGTGIAVLSILTSKVPDLSRLQNALHKLQNSHPILMSRLLYNPSMNTTTTSGPFSFITSPNAFIQVKTFDLESTSDILRRRNSKHESVSPFHVITEHELNMNSWCNTSSSNSTVLSKSDMFYATNYALSDEKWVVVLRLHASSCDRTTAVSLLRELLVLASEEEQRGEMCVKEEVSLGIESLIPDGLTKKAIWARGMNMLGYSVESLGLTNLKFIDVKSTRHSQVVRLQMNQFETERVVNGCKKRGIKLSGALVAAGLIAAHSSRSQRHKYYKQKKYGVVTLTDCRSLLEPPLSSHNFGFYHSAIMNTHVVKGTEKLWDLATRAYMSMANYKKSNKHFSDMADLNFLMCKAIENPGLTSASALRTSFMSVFEDTVVDDTSRALKEAVGLVDYVGCASVHGIGPSIALLDTIRDGQLDCVCVYPAPLHSREQIVELLGKMKRVLVEGCDDVVA